MSTFARNLVVTDLETTGTNNLEHEIIQIARVVLDTQTLEIDSFMDAYVIPEEWESRDPEAMDVNKIDILTLNLQGIELHDALEKWHEGIDWGNSVVAAWGNDFEMDFLREAHLKFYSSTKDIPYPFKSVDIRSWILIPKYAGFQTDYPSLREACAFMGVEYDKEAAHNALYDARVTAEVAVKIISMYRGGTLEDIQEIDL